MPKFTFIFHLWLQFNDLQECYLQKRRQSANQLHVKQESDKNVIHREGYNAGLADFQSVLSTFTRYRYGCQFSFCDGHKLTLAPSIPLLSLSFPFPYCTCSLSSVILFNSSIPVDLELLRN